MSRTKLLVLCTLVASLALFVGTASAANPPVATLGDVFSVDYFANANTTGAPDATLRIVHPGRDRWKPVRGHLRIRYQRRDV